MRKPLTDNSISTGFFAFPLILSAALLFAIQPLIGQLMLPTLGGAPAVWHTLMVFFQGLLLGGYLYAHVTRDLPLKTQLLGHGFLVILAVITLSLALPKDLLPPTEGGFYAFLLSLAFTVVGPAYLLLATTAPLLQRLYARSHHQKTTWPYFLYALSNIGSFGALLAVPFILEPLMNLKIQLNVWQGGFYLYAASLALLGYKLWQQNPPRLIPEKTSDAPTWRTYSQYLLLAAVPSALLIAVTDFLTVHIAPMPMLWVLPLALYLLTYIIAFSRQSAFYQRRILPNIAVILAIGAGLLTLVGHQHGYVSLGLHLLLFFTITWLCHGKLAQKAPHSSHLTHFYLALALGGVLGGLFSAIVAPSVLSRVYEYPALLLLAALLLPPVKRYIGLSYVAVFALCAIMLAALLLLFPYYSLIAETLAVEQRIIAATGAFIALAIIAMRLYPLAVVGLMATIIGFGVYLPTIDNNINAYSRTFFGSYMVRFDPDKLENQLIMGADTVVQGKQSLLPENDLTPLYMYPLDGLGTHLPEHLYQKPMGVIGLGVGVLACLHDQTDVDFYEIDPEVARYAREEFTYLSQCPSESTVTIGDGRQKFATVPDGHYGISVLDAFSSPAIPSHLLTTQSLEMMLDKTATDGVLLVNFTNIHFDLLPLLKTQAHALDLKMMIANQDKKRRSRWAILARDSGHFGELSNHPNWQTVPTAKLTRPWVDGYTPLIRLLF